MNAASSPSGSSPSEAETFLAAHPEIEAIDVVLHDSNGIGRGKIIRRSELMAVYAAGRFMPMSILGLDICGEDVHETGLIWDQGDGDLRAWPVPGTLAAMQGTSPARAEVLLSLYTLDGAAMTSDPRHALQIQLDALAAEGMFPAAAFELEFFLVANQRDADGRLRPADAVLDGRVSNKTEVYSVDHLQLNHYYTGSDEELAAKIGRGPNLAGKRSAYARKVMRTVENIEAEVVEDRVALDYLARIGQG